MNIPNALSLMRIFLVAPFLVAVIYRQYPLAFGLFVTAGISDFLDGYLARRLQQKSVLGTFLDPLGDRLLSTVAFIALSMQGLLPPWLAVTVVAKDLYVGIGAGILYFAGRQVVAEASLWGKLATLMQIVTIGFALLEAFGFRNALVLNSLFYATGLVTIFACVHYIWHGMQDFSDDPKT